MIKLMCLHFIKNSKQMKNKELFIFNLQLKLTYRNGIHIYHY